MLINEIIDSSRQYLYHSTTLENASRILYHDVIRPSHNINNLVGVSTTRSLFFAKSYDGGGYQVIFVLDWQKIQTKHKMIQHDYFAGSKSGGYYTPRKEAEEFVLTNNNGLYPLSKYLIKILIPKLIYDNVMNDEDEKYDNEVKDLVTNTLVELY
jgi:hypothetical protein